MLLFSWGKKPSQIRQIDNLLSTTGFTVILGWKVLPNSLCPRITPQSMAKHTYQIGPINMDQTAKPVPSLHQDDADENIKQLQECSSLYLALQDCLVNTNRNFKSCQKEIQNLKSCHERRRRRRND
ncbi:hypothetical protein ACS0TY_014443 [Phlomoides rotata]